MVSLIKQCCYAILYNFNDSYLLGVVFGSNIHRSCLEKGVDLSVCI